MNDRNDAPRVKKTGFLADLFAGYLMGIAFIIPGFSGGSIAAIVGIYERLITAIADIFKSFKESVKTLLPIGIGLLLGAVSLLYPLKLALAWAPLPTVSHFVGLALGGMLSVTDKLRGKIRVTNVLALGIPLLFAAGLCFIPTGAEVDLFSLNFSGYAVLFFVGVIGSAALVIPGISGSMLLLILGYYNPIINLITNHLLKLRDVGKSVLVLGVTVAGIAVGFVIISVIMKLLLKKCPRGTYFAIVGFIVGSIPSAFISTAKDAGMTVDTLPSSVWHWVACCALLILGFAAALLLIIKVKKLRQNNE
ncbi:MAG: DUF368 domain-containing protein [Clostridia bacterium]|nr:DUF368 domain-containing protein [Clostridia bacterium]